MFILLRGYEVVAAFIKRLIITKDVVEKEVLDAVIYSETVIYRDRFAIIAHKLFRKTLGFWAQLKEEFMKTPGKCAQFGAKFL